MNERELVFYPNDYTVFTIEDSEYDFLATTDTANKIDELRNSYEGTIPNENLIDVYKVFRKEVQPGNKISDYKKEKIEANVLISMPRKAYFRKK